MNGWINNYGMKCQTKRNNNNGGVWLNGVNILE